MLQNVYRFRFISETLANELIREFLMGKVLERDYVIITNGGSSKDKIGINVGRTTR